MLRPDIWYYYLNTHPRTGIEKRAIKNISPNISIKLFDINFLDRKFAIIVQDISPDAIVAKQKISALVAFIEKPFRFSRLLKLYQNRFFERKESEISEHTKRFWYIVCYYSLLTINTAVFEKWITSDHYFRKNTKKQSRTQCSTLFRLN